MTTLLVAFVACAAPLQVQSPAPQEERTSVDVDGATVVREERPYLESGQSTENTANDSVRWLHADEGQLWIPQEVAIGDYGSTVIAGKYLNLECLSLYSAGSSAPIFDHFPGDDPRVLRILASAADHAPFVASVILREISEGEDPEIVPTLAVHDSFSKGDPRWSFDFPPANYNTLPGVRFSRNGKLVLGWWSVWTDTEDHIQVEAFTSDGKTISSGFIEGGSVISHPVQLSDDGRWAVFYVIPPGELVVYDVLRGEVELRRRGGGGSTGCSISGDGRRVARTERFEIEVLERHARGVWESVFSLVLDDSVRTTYTTLDQDGSRLAYVIQGASREEFTVVLHDLDADVELFRHTFAAPGTTTQLHAFGLELDDAGRTLAGISWGDSFNLTPEVFVFDETGALLCEVDTRGSAMTMDLTPEGDILVVGAKGTHANVWGAGGDVLVVEARPKSLRVLGRPELGGTVHVEAQAPGQVLFLAVGERLLPEPGPHGLALDPSALSLVLGPLALEGGALTADWPVPSDPALAGLAAHVQGASGGVNTPLQLTNKVSLRLVPPLP